MGGGGGRSFASYVGFSDTILNEKKKMMRDSIGMQNKKIL